MDLGHDSVGIRAEFKKTTRTTVMTQIHGT